MRKEDLVKTYKFKKGSLAYDLTFLVYNLKCARYKSKCVFVKI